MGTIRRNQHNKLFLEFRFRGVRCREKTGLKDTPRNRKAIEKRLSLNPKYGNTHKNRLIASGHIQPRRLITSTGAITLLEPTYKGRVALRDAGHEVKEPREGIVHLYWKTRISEAYRKKGYSVSVEEIINGRPDIIARKDGKRIAIEIETGKSDAIGNIQRALKAGFDEVICVATDRKVEEKIRDNSLVYISDEKINVTSVVEFEDIKNI